VLHDSGQRCATRSTIAGRNQQHASKVPLGTIGKKLRENIFELCT
jgi:hypothetical protein